MASGSIRLIPDPVEDGREPAILTGKATQRISQLILDGELEPNARINEVHLGGYARHLPHPIARGAAAAGRRRAADLHSNRGFTVRAFALAEIIDAYTMRRLAECLAARLGAERGVPDAERMAMEQALDAGDLLLADTVGVR